MRYAKNKKVTPPKRRPFLLPLIIVLVIVLLAGAGYVLYNKRQNSKERANETSTAQTNSPGESKVDLSPPTEEEKNDTEQHKDDLAEQKQNETTTPASGDTIPVIHYAGASTYSSNLEVSASVPVVEDGGTCTMTASLNGKTVTKTVTAVRNAKNTICPFDIPRSDFPNAGNWSVTVSYSSANHKGTSQSKTMQVK